MKKHKHPKYTERYQIREIICDETNNLFIILALLTVSGMFILFFMNILNCFEIEKLERDTKIIDHIKTEKYCAEEKIIDIPTKQITYGSYTDDRGIPGHREVGINLSHEVPIDYDKLLLVKIVFPEEPYEAPQYSFTMRQKYEVSPFVYEAIIPAQLEELYLDSTLELTFCQTWKNRIILEEWE